MKTINRALLLLGSLALSAHSMAAFVPYGAGNISDTINPDGWECTVDYGNWIHSAGVVEPGVDSCDPIGAPTPIYPHVVAPAADEPTMTHRWWGSVSFFGEQTIGDTADSAYITPDPMTARISNMGARIMGIPGGLSTKNDTEYTYSIPDPFTEVFDGIAVGNSIYSTMDAYLKDYSDGSVTVEWRSGSTPVMEATFVHGSPYAFFTALQGDLVVRAKAADGGEKGIFHQSGNSLGVWTDVAGNRNNFLITGHGTTQFADVNSAQIGVNNSAKSMTVTLLPQVSGTPSSAMISTFEQYATNRIDEVLINYSVDRSDNSVTVSHQYLLNGAPVTTMAGMLPLHWKNSGQALSGYKVRSARGMVQFAQTSGFSYEIPYVGVLPSFPAGLGTYDEAQLRALVSEFMAQGSSQWNTFTDTYWAGKNYGKVAELAAIARSIGMVAEADQLINWLKGELEDWFRADTSGSLDTTKYFVYDNNWNTLLGFSESFGAQQQLNDHHFHYGYFVRAAAEICRVDPSWCGSNAWGPMVELLIRDYAGGRNDPMFPYLRNFDPAYGFSWASGHANFVLGNNNESTSEAANAYGAVILYGLITGNNDLVERGMYLHASSTATYWEYWNNIDRYYSGVGGDHDNFPMDYSKMTTSIIWGNGHVFGTWFSGAYAHILGIQGLPLSPLVLHIGQYADYLGDYFALGMSGESTNGQPSGLPDDHWRDVWWNIWAMTDAPAAAADLAAYGFNYPPEQGETKAHTYHWVHTFAGIGHLATGTGSLTADDPAAVAFTKNGETTYIAYNYGSTDKYVTLSDGMALNVKPGSFRVKTSGEAPDQPGDDTGTSVKLFQHCDYTGWAASFGVGSYTAADIQARGGINDDASSVQVPSGYEVTLYEHDNFGGAAVTLTADSNCLVDFSFNDNVSSLVVSEVASFQQRIEAEDYSNMSGVQTEVTQDPEGGNLNVGWIDAGDWMAYANVTIPETAIYRVEYRVASPNGSVLSLDLNGGATQLGQVSVPATGGWQTWTTVSHEVEIPAGTHSIGIYAPQGGWNINWFRITQL
jgi:endo-1,3(4)-beta-glucanase